MASEYYGGEKEEREIRVCVNFTDLNQACPNNPFFVPKINQLVDATYEHPRMSFLDAFQGYQCEKAFQDLKEYFMRAPMSAPEPGEDLFMYLSVSKHAVSTVL